MLQLDKEAPCPICGQQSYEWGKLVANSLHLATDQDSWLKRLGAGLRSKLTARVCRECKNVQIFAADD